MGLNAKHASHLPALVDALLHTEGDVLELGVGVNSTFALHWLCLYMGRRLVSYEHDLGYYRQVQHCWSDWHELYKVNDWDQADIERPWGVALVDHAPAERRVAEIARLADCAQAIVIHDTQGSQGRHYRYEQIWPLFKWRKDYKLERPYSAVVSNFVDLSQWEAFGR